MDLVVPRDPGIPHHSLIFCQPGRKARLFKTDKSDQSFLSEHHVHAVNIRTKCLFSRVLPVHGYRGALPRAETTPTKDGCMKKSTLRTGTVAALLTGSVLLLSAAPASADPGKPR